MTERANPSLAQILLASASTFILHSTYSIQSKAETCKETENMAHRYEKKQSKEPDLDMAQMLEKSERDFKINKYGKYVKGSLGEKHK